MAFKGTADSDYVVGLVAGRIGADIYLIDRVKGQWSLTETLRQVVTLTQRYPRATTKLIEDKANGTAIIDALRHHLTGIVAVEPDGGKVARARAAEPVVEGGNLYLPNPRPHGHVRPDRAWSTTSCTRSPSFPTARTMMTSMRSRSSWLDGRSRSRSIGSRCSTRDATDRVAASSPCLRPS
jgi:predicted phage terminase large subunit-like protein